MLRALGSTSDESKPPEDKLSKYVTAAVLVAAVYLIFRPMEERGPGWRINR